MLRKLLVLSTLLGTMALAGCVVTPAYTDGDGYGYYTSERYYRPDPYYPYVYSPFFYPSFHGSIFFHDGFRDGHHFRGGHDFRGGHERGFGMGGGGRR